ncbi:MAG: capsule assembly Wzi family protein [Pseudomonadota bacterium]
MNFRYLAITALVVTQWALPVAADSTGGTRHTLYFGALSDDFLGRAERYDTLAFSSASLSGQMDQGRLGLSYTLGVKQQLRNDDPEAALRFDASLQLGQNWRIGVGVKDRHWSPSQYTSLAISRNAEPAPAAYLSFSAPQANGRLLSWLGPTRGDIFIGVTDDPGQPDNAKFAGFRFAASPIAGLEIDLFRMIQYGGAGQPDGLGTLFDIFVGDTNTGANAAANQLAGVGLSYSLPGFADANGARIYTQIAGEDEAGGLPSCPFFLVGAEWKTNLWGRASTLTVERVDTRTQGGAGGNCGTNQAYNNANYSYRNKGVVMGAAIGTQSVSTVLYGEHDMDAWSLDWSVGTYSINEESFAQHSLSSTAQSGEIVTIGASRPVNRGTLSGILAYQSFDLDTAGQDAGVRVGVAYSARF